SLPHEQVVGVECREGEDTHACFREGHEQGARTPVAHEGTASFGPRRQTAKVPGTRASVNRWSAMSGCRTRHRMWQLHQRLTWHLGRAFRFSSIPRSVTPVFSTSNSRRL